MERREFSDRLAQLRMQKGVSAREMSLSLGQHESYINTIENGKAYPSMESFFYICEYLSVTPAQFFNIDISNPSKPNELTASIRAFPDADLDVLLTVAKGLHKHS